MVTASTTGASDEAEAAGTLASAFVANTVDDGPPGLEPTLGSLRRAIDEIESALGATRAVRAALTDLAAGTPGDDRVLLSFLRSRLNGPDARLLEILAGISEEHRALLRAEAEILAIYERSSREPLLALERLATSTADYRTVPVATYAPATPGTPAARAATLRDTAGNVGARSRSVPSRSLPSVRFVRPGSPAVRRAFPLVAGLVGLAVGIASIAVNAAEALVVPSLAAIALTLGITGLGTAAEGGRRSRGAVLVAALAVAAELAVLQLPTWLYGGDLNGVIHRSVLSVPLLLLAAIAATSFGIRWSGRDAPAARDLAIYPVLLVPIGIALVAYVALLAPVVAQGIGGLTPSIVFTAWQERLVDQNGEPTFVYQVGLLNHLLGTLLLMLLTCAISIAPGVGAGLFVSEYPGRIASVIRFATSMLRAVAVFIIGLVALQAVTAVAGLPAEDPVSQLIRGTYADQGGFVHPGRGSFVLAAAFLSFLVVPVIARATEEGLRSLPREIREGSLAVGATEGYGLRRILLPWAMPGIVTGLLLGAAEAAGSLAAIMYIAGVGNNGVDVLGEVTSLDFALFQTRYGLKPFIKTMEEYRFTAALLLLAITLGLTVAAMVMRRWSTRRYRGSLTAA